MTFLLYRDIQLLPLMQKITLDNTAESRQEIKQERMKEYERKKEGKRKKKRATEGQGNVM